jgi:hypothetical protein
MGASFYWGDSTPQISHHLGGATSGDLATVDIFATNKPAATSPSFYGVLERFLRGAANAPRPSAREAVKRNITDNMPLSPQTARLDPISDAYQTLERKIVRDTPP